MPFGNLKLELHIDDWIQQNLYFLDIYEDAELKVMGHNLSSDSTFIDIGANFGLYSLSASQKITKEGEILCFEPFPQNYRALTNNISRNNLSMVTAENMAIGDQEGSLKLYYNPNEYNLGMVSANYIENADFHKVEMISLDSYLNSNPRQRIDFIKIDVEGFEYQALLGMKNTLAQFGPLILIEILDEMDSKENANNVHIFLVELGYKKHYIDDKGSLSDTNVNNNRKNYLYQKSA